MANSCDFPVIRTWHLCISGFLQHAGQPTGMHKLWLRLGNHLRDATTQVELQPWNARWADVAEHIKISRNGLPPRVFLYAYSWGAGWGFLQLSRELRKRGLNVHAAVLCYPVYRSRWFSFSYRSLSPVPRIVVPDNVRFVDWLYQRNDWPRGHQVVPADPRRTRVSAGIEVRGVVHTSMDDCDEFHNLAMRVAGMSL